MDNNSKQIYNTEIAAGENKLIHIPVDKLPTGTLIKIPVYVFNGLEKGPTVLIQGGLHGDEINGVETCKRLLISNSLETIAKGCVIVVPLLNIFGFIHFSREVTDGKDVNRSYPGSRSGSLASQIAYKHLHEIVHHIDFGIDLHTGGSMRNNHPQIRYSQELPESKKLAKIFNAPFYFPSKLIPKSFRQVSCKLGKPIIVYEAGESMRFDEFAINEGLEGILRVLNYFHMISKAPIITTENANCIHLTNRKWIRAKNGGVFCPCASNGRAIQKDQILGHISDAFGNNRKAIKAPFNGYIICVNNKPIVSKGEAIFHVGK